MGSTSGRESVLRALRERFPGRLEQGERLSRYRGDYGVFELDPLTAFRPADEAEIRDLLGIAREHACPVVARAGGSNTGGAAITTGILLLFDHRAFAGVEVHADSGLAFCGPSLRHDHLQSALEEHGFWLPSDPSSGPLSRIGGNVNTRASGPHALRHGAIQNYLRDVRFITAPGDVVDTRHPEEVPARYLNGLRDLAGRIRADCRTVRYLEERREFKWASGYELLALVDHPHDPVRALPRVIAGSVGTLGILTRADVAGVPRPSSRAALLLRFRETREACAAAVELARDAEAVEIVSRSALELLREHTDVLGGDRESAALLIVEYAGRETDGPPSAGARARRAARQAGDGPGRVTAERPTASAGHGEDGPATGGASSAAGGWSLTAPPVIAESAARIEQIWQARKALLPVIRRIAGDRGRPYSVVNDVGVPPARLAELIEGAEAVFSHHGLLAPIYGHAGSGNLHLRPLFPPGDHALVKEVTREIYELVCRLGGTVTAEHGMGRLRAPFLEDEWGPRIVSYMRELKHIFDPDDLLNPGVMFASCADGFRRCGWDVEPVLS